MSETTLIPLREARQRLGISPTTMAKLVKEGRLTIYANPLDRREKLVSVAEVEALRVPTVVQRRVPDA